MTRYTYKRSALARHLIIGPANDDTGIPVVSTQDSTRWVWNRITRIKIALTRPKNIRLVKVISYKISYEHRLGNVVVVYAHLLTTRSGLRWVEFFDTAPPPRTVDCTKHRVYATKIRPWLQGADFSDIPTFDSYAQHRTYSELAGTCGLFEMYTD